MPNLPSTGSVIADAGIFIAAAPIINHFVEKIAKEVYKREELPKREGISKDEEEKAGTTTTSQGTQTERSATDSPSKSS